MPPRAWARSTCAREPAEPIALGGHHERDRRPGTENVPGIAALGAAAEVAAECLAAESESVSALRDRLEKAVLGQHSGRRREWRRRNRTPNTTNMYFDGIDGEALVIALDLRGFAASTGSACSSGAVTPSHVLTAMGSRRSAPAPACAFRWAAQHHRTGGRAGGGAGCLGRASAPDLRPCLSRAHCRRHERRSG